jgi:hypothetical protein
VLTVPSPVAIASEPDVRHIYVRLPTSEAITRRTPLIQLPTGSELAGSGGFVRDLGNNGSVECREEDELNVRESVLVKDSEVEAVALVADAADLEARGRDLGVGLLDDSHAKGGSGQDSDDSEEFHGKGSGW